MFAGLTAAQIATRNIGRQDEAPPDPPRWLECYCGRHVKGDGSTPGSEVVAVYEVGCGLAQYEAHCAEHQGHGFDSVFYCEGCGHEHETNTSWELHYANVDGEVLCLKCAAARQIQATDFWITDPEQVTFDWLRTRPHFPLELTDLETLDVDGGPDNHVAGETLDATTGGHLYDEAPGAGLRAVADFREMVATELRTHERVGVVITRAYQFAVYLEIVAPAAAGVSA